MNTSLNTPGPTARRGGFTLAELMVVIVILGLLATAVAPKLLDRLADAKWGKADVDLHTIDQAVIQYMIANAGRQLDSLEQLVLPDENGKRFLDRDNVPKDPWGNEYGYEPPVGREPYLVICYGRDGAPGGEGDDRDVTSRDIKNR